MDQATLDELDNAAANRFFWDGAAASYIEKLVTTPEIAIIYQQLTAKILSSAKFDPSTTALMDFACGNGAFSTTLAPHCKTIVGVDISQGMVDAYNGRMRDLGIPNTRALRAELKVDDPLIVGEKFDVILCANSYKHIGDNIAITRVLKSYLKPNGVLFVIDTIRGKTALNAVVDVQSLMHGTPPSRPKNLMSHMQGYVEDEIKTVFEEAGLLNFTFEEAFEQSTGRESYGLFLAKGVCPS